MANQVEHSILLWKKCTTDHGLFFYSYRLFLTAESAEDAERKETRTVWVAGKSKSLRVLCVLCG
jgi:hypothetical protein